MSEPAAAGLLALLALLGGLGGLLAHVFGVDAPAHLAWAATTALLLVPLTISVTRTLLRRDVGVDAIALRRHPHRPSCPPRLSALAQSGFGARRRGIRQREVIPAGVLGGGEAPGERYRGRAQTAEHA